MDEYPEDNTKSNLSIIDNESTRALFEAIPLPSFLIDNRMRVRAFNTAASRWFGGDGGIRYRMKTGEFLRCVNDSRYPDGCGETPYCKNCAVRTSVAEVFSSQFLVSRRYKMERISGEGTQDTYLNISASPLLLGKELFTLVILEDTTELSELKNILPICSQCKKIRNDQNFWENIDTYLHQHNSLDFTHSLCPQCAKTLYPDLFA